MSQTKEEVQNKYAISHDDYDRYRLVDFKGQLLSEYDIKLFMELLREVLDNDNKEVLEVAAGTGRFTLPALEVCDKIIATDINQSLLEGLKDKLKKNDYQSCEVIIEDAFDMSFQDATFDIIYSLHFIPRMKAVNDQEEAIKEMVRVLKPGGYLLFNFRNKNSLIYRLLYNGHSNSLSEIDQILNKFELICISKRGKFFISKSLIKILPTSINKQLLKLEWSMRKLWIKMGWDIFILAQKKQN